ncbi:MAG: DUF4097 family beta strand repeat protein [Thermotogae bacterium]|nr:DUF4097 family beta strand repeat protein [Thermotogota bacterium]
MSERNRLINIPVEGVNTITFDGVGADISVHPSSDDKFVLKIDLRGTNEEIEDYDPLITKTGSNMRVNLEPKKEKWFSLFKRRLVVKVSARIPVSIKTLNVRTVSGDIDITDISAEIALDTVSGDINAKRDNSNAPVSFKSVSGDMKFTDLDISMLNGKTVSGDIHAENVKGERLNITSVSGDISIISSHFKSGKRLFTTSGDIIFNGPPAPNAKNDLNSVSGDIILTFTKFPSLKLEYHTSSGDFKPKLKGSFSKIGKHDYLFTVGKGEERYNIKTTSGDLTVKSPGREPEFTVEEEDEEIKTVRKLYEENKITLEEMRALMESMGYTDEEIEKYCEGGKNNEKRRNNEDSEDDRRS